MSKLLIANLKRLKKNKLFWTIAVLFVVCTFFGLMNTYEYEQTLIEAHMEMEDSSFTPTTATDLLFQMSSFIGLASAFMLAIFIGTEYHDNTMRNKLICGQSRVTVYFANFFTSLLITLTFWLIPILVILCVGIPLLGTSPMTTALFTKIIVTAAIGFLYCTLHTHRDACAQPFLFAHRLYLSCTRSFIYGKHVREQAQRTGNLSGL